MKPLPSSAKRGLIRTAYLLPLLCGIVMLVYFCIPHLFFIYGNTANETLSTLDLVGNAMSECTSALKGESERTSDGIYFSYTVLCFVVLFWIALVIYFVTAIASAICSLYAFSKEPTARESNRAKRWFRFCCPNRVWYVISNLLLLFAAAFPHLLILCYHRQMGYTEMSLHFFFLSDLILAILLTVVNLALYLALLPAQSEEHLDLFRLYKAK